ncbi:acyl-CoA synthetase [Variovorax sp. M-6]|uniref:acyl-CoA synthetase n=1 Tax=Variovorax sp. M-6 TaxID=3233041 RepID=UPI003F94881C
MMGPCLLDRAIGAEVPPLRTAEEAAAFEATPYAERIAAQSTYEALQLGAAHAPDEPAFHFLTKGDPDETPFTVTHRQFIARVTQAANLFSDLGVGPKDVVSLLLPLVPESFYALFGAQAAGIANPVNAWLSSAQIAEILRAAKTKVLVTLGPAEGSDIWEKVQAIRGELPDLEAIVVVRGAPDGAGAVHSFDERIDACPSDRLLSGRRIAADDTAACFHTGGTTGSPKLVRHTHANQVYQAWALSLMLPVGAGRTLLFGLPLFHVGGALTQGLATLCAAGTLVVVSPAGWRDPQAVRNVWRLVERWRPVVFGGVPTVLAAALNVPAGDADVSSIEIVSGGGSAIPVAVCKAYGERLHRPVLEVYGMTETSSVHSMSYAERPLRIGSVGHALPYSRVRVVKVDAEGRGQGDCAVNEIGVVAMAGPGVFKGYLSDAHNRQAFVEPGWVNSGDLGRLDEDGYLWLTGRAKDLIIRGGHNIDPLAIEEVFFQHPAVALAAVVGQPDTRAGEMPVAFVQLKPGATLDEAALLDFVRARTPERAAVPVNVFFVDPMPLTAVGKIFKPALRWDAARRVVTQLLADLPQAGGFQVVVGADAVHGSLVRIGIRGVPEAEQAALALRVEERLGGLELHHRVVCVN